jgi:hypothetical protein
MNEVACPRAPTTTSSTRQNAMAMHYVNVNERLLPVPGGQKPPAPMATTTVTVHDSEGPNRDIHIELTLRHIKLISRS